MQRILMLFCEEVKFHYRSVYLTSIGRRDKKAGRIVSERVQQMSA